MWKEGLWSLWKVYGRPEAASCFAQMLIQPCNRTITDIPQITIYIKNVKENTERQCLSRFMMCEFSTVMTQTQILVIFMVESANRKKTSSHSPLPQSTLDQSFQTLEALKGTDR